MRCDTALPRAVLPCVGRGAVVLACGFGGSLTARALCMAAVTCRLLPTISDARKSFLFLICRAAQAGVACVVVQLMRAWQAPACNGTIASGCTSAAPAQMSTGASFSPVHCTSSVAPGTPHVTSRFTMLGTSRRAPRWSKLSPQPRVQHQQTNLASKRCALRCWAPSHHAVCAAEWQSTDVCTPYSSARQ